MKLLRLLTIGCIGSILFSSCSDKDKEDTPPAPEEKTTRGAYVLVQGNMSTNIQGELDYYDLDSQRLDSRIFYKANGRYLGDTPQCGVQYGSKIYVGMSISNTVEVMSANDNVSLAQIRLEAGKTGTQPRSMIAHGGKVYISMFDGYVARLDTITMKIDATVQVGPNPEIMTLHNGKLYVPNSDGMNWAVGYGTTASVIDISTFSIARTITVPLNPKEFVSLGGNLYLLSMGDYGDVKGAVYKINDTGTSDPGITKIEEATMIAGSTSTGKLYIFNAPWQVTPTYYVYDVATEVKTSWNPEDMVIPAGVGIDPGSGNIFATTYRMNGTMIGYDLPSTLLVYDNEGKLMDKKDVGVGPACIFFTDL